MTEHSSVLVNTYLHSWTQQQQDFVWVWTVAMVPKCQVSRVQPHQQMGANVHADELWTPSDPEGQGSSRLGRKRFIVHFFQSFVPTGSRHLTQVHGLLLYPPCTWCSKFFVLLACLRGRHMESLRYGINYTGSQCSCSRRDLVQYDYHKYFLNLFSNRLKYFCYSLRKGCDNTWENPAANTATFSVHTEQTTKGEETI